MESDWIAQLPPLIHDSAPISLQDNSRGVDPYKRNPYSKVMFATNTSTSESIGRSQSPASSGRRPQVSNWSSAESFLSSSSTNFASSLEQCRSLNSQLNEIKLENAELIKNNRILSAKLDTLAKAYETLANRIPQTLNQTVTQLETREMNPAVRFWTRQEWMASNTDRIADLDEGVNTGTRGRTRAAQGINVNMKYIEDRNGQPINGHLASDIRRHARAIFVGFALKGYLFTSWTEADHDSLKTYYREMSERFEELRLCANDWKAETIALDIYRTWRDQWEKRQKKRKKPEKTTDDLVEDDKDGNNSDESDDDVSLKHGADRTAFEIARATKKRKSAPDAVAAANFIHTSAPGQTQQTLAAPVINMIPGALTHTGKEGILHGSLLQPMPSLQGSFNIINPLQSSHNAASIVSPFVGMPSGAQLPPQFASNVPALGAVNPIHNNVYPAQLPAAAANAKSRRMRPTKSITARNLCAIDWCKENKGTSDDFNKFWNGLPKEEKERYEALSKERSEQEKAST